MARRPPFPAAPPPLARRLLVGGDGPGLVAARDAALAAGAPWAALADALSLAVWEGAPFWPEAAALLVARQEARPFLSPELARLAAAVVAATRPAAPDPYFDRLAARRDPAKLVAYLLARQAKEPENPALLYKLAVFGPMHAPALETVAGVFAGLTGPFAALGVATAADLAWLDGRSELAADRYRQAEATFPAEAVRLGLAEVLWRQGERQSCLALLAAGLRARPWDVLTQHRLYDRASGLAEARTPLPGSVAVLLYTYNSAALLDRTLAALARTDWRMAPGRTGDPARLIVLDNGSGDDTAAVLAAWRERLGTTLAVVRLPVNVGAPAARNWLARLPQTVDREFVAYLDDDAVVPADWLGRFGAAVAAFPEAGVWGCRIRGRDAPFFVQCADSHLFPRPRTEDGFGRAFDLASPWLVTPDRGQYAVCRPCSSVTGCCHLFRTSVLGAVGDFDIRFSPTQYDDLDHDLRLLLAGRVPVCQGHLVVEHAKSTGSAANPGGAQYGSGFANQFKLHRKYDDAEVARAADVAFAVLARVAARQRDSLTEMGWLAEDPAEGAPGHGR